MPGAKPLPARELDLLRQVVMQNQERLSKLDETGTRGVQAVQVRLDDVIKELATLKAEVTERFAAHQHIHDQDHQDRVSGRRWLVTTGIAGLIAMATVIGLLVQLTVSLHH